VVIFVFSLGVIAWNRYLPVSVAVLTRT